MTAPCLGNSTPYDILIDDTRGPAFHAALREARRMCRGCPIVSACLIENRDQQWARAVAGIGKLAPTRRDTCGKPWGQKAHARHGEATCDDCRAANNHNARLRAARKTEIDEARVERRMAGERVGALNTLEAREVIRRMYTRGQSLSAIRQITGIKVERYYKADELKREVAA